VKPDPTLTVNTVTAYGVRTGTNHEHPSNRGEATISDGIVTDPPDLRMLSPKLNVQKRIKPFLLDDFGDSAYAAPRVRSYVHSSLTEVSCKPIPSLNALGHRGAESPTGPRSSFKSPYAYRDL
jgi:hypothetical protein